MTLNHTAPSGRLYTHFGFTVNDTNAAVGANITVTANFSNATSSTFTTSSVAHYWIRFAAPTGTSITSINFSEGLSGFALYDDISFVATPEPTSLSLLTLDSLLGLRRKH